MGKLLLVGLGGFVGSVGRYLLSGFVQKLSRSEDFPFGTLAVNILGCLCIGFFTQLAEARGFLGPEARLFLFMGLLGGFTTFSTFGNETINLWQDRQSWLALVNIAGHVVLGLGAAWLGHNVAHGIWR